MELPKVSPGAGQTAPEGGGTDPSCIEPRSADSVARSRWDQDSVAKQVLRLPAAKENGRSSRDIVRLGPSCPKQATCPGFPSVLEDSEKRWIFGEEVLCPLRKTLPREQTGPLSLPASCPERRNAWGLPSPPEPRQRPRPSADAGRSPEFPSEPVAVRLVPCWSSASETEGLSPAAPGQGWAELPRAVPLWPRKKEAATLTLLAGRQQKHGHSGTSYTAEGQISGCPLASPVDAVSLLAAASCSPCSPGFPSSRTLTQDCVPKQAQTRALGPDEDMESSSLRLSQEDSSDGKVAGESRSWRHRPRPACLMAVSLF